MTCSKYKFSTKSKNKQTTFFFLNIIYEFKIVAQILGNARAEVYSELCQTSNTKLFAITVRLC